MHRITQATQGGKRAERCSSMRMGTAITRGYTYRVNEAIRDCEAEVHLWCGDREPYAIKSHNMLKPLLKHYEEKIWPDAGHGVMLYFHTDEYLDAIRDVLGRIGE